MGIKESIKWSYIGNITSKSFSLAFQLLVLRWLEVGDAAEYFLTLSISYFVLLPTLYPLSGVALRYIPFYESKSKSKMSLLLMSYLVYAIILGIVLFTFTYLFGDNIIKEIYPSLESKVIFLGISFLVLSVYTSVGDSLNGKKMFKERATLDIINSMLKIMLITVLHKTISLNYGTVMIIFYISTLSGVTYGMIKLKDYVKFYKGFLLRMSEIIDMLKYSIGTTTTTIRGFISGWLDTALLGYFSIPSDVSGYNGTFSIARTSSNILISPLTGTIFPYLVSNLNKKGYVEGIVKEVSKALLYISVVMATAIIFLSKEMIELIIPKYIGYEYLFYIFSAGFVFFTFSTLFRIILMAMRWVKPIFYSSIMVVIGNIILNLLLIPKYGALGAAISTVSVFFIEFSYLYYYIKKSNYDFKIFDKRPIILGIIMFAFLIFTGFDKIEGVLLSLMLKLFVIFALTSLYILFFDREIYIYLRDIFKFRK